MQALVLAAAAQVSFYITGQPGQVCTRCAYILCLSITLPAPVHRPTQLPAHTTCIAHATAVSARARRAAISPPGSHSRRFMSLISPPLHAYRGLGG